jgi:hypothetical protein
MAIMGVDVLLMRVHKAGSGPKRHLRTVIDSVGDSKDIFAQFCEASRKPMLQRVKPNGSLVLTTLDMPQFIAEIESLRKPAVSAAQKALLDDIERLARTCGDDRTLELHLEGD